MTEWNNSVAPRLQNRKRLLQLGVTEVFKSVDRDENLDQLSELGLTEMDDSVRQKCTKSFWKFKSMMNRGLRVLLTQSGSNLT